MGAPRRPIATMLGAVALAALGACSTDGASPESGPPDSQAPGSTALSRPDTPGNTRLFAYGPTDVVESFASEHFRVHFTRSGPNQVAAADTDASGVPDYVELFAANYEDALDHYLAMGFRAPLSDEGQADNGGDGLFDVYLVDFNGQGDSAYRDDVCNGDVCSGYTLDDNNAGQNYPSLDVAMRILASHELFHAIQSSYDKGQGTIMAEGTAVWGTETFDPSLGDFESFLPGYLDNTDRPIDEPIGGAGDVFSYGSAIFFWFLEEHFGDGTILGLWQRCENGAGGVDDPNWFAVLDGYLSETKSTAFSEAFVDFATWNLFTGKHHDASRGYAAGAGYPSVKMEEGAAPYSDDSVRLYHAASEYFRVPADGRDTMTAALVARDPADLDGLVLLVVDDQGQSYGPVTRADDVTAVPPISLSPSDALVVVAINTAMTGDSKKPGICIGSPDEVASCKSALEGQGGAGGGASTSSGAGGADGASDDGDGCGCRLASGQAASGAWAAAFGLALLVRRRRNAGARRA